MQYSDIYLQYGRIIWGIVAIPWIVLSARYEKTELPITTAFSVFVFLVVAKAYKHKQHDVFAVMHWWAAFFHATSSLVLAAVAWGLDKSWQGPLLRFRSDWVLLNTSSTESCSTQPCYIDFSMLLIPDYRIPLIALVAIAACISSLYHTAICVSSSELKSIANGTSTAKWKDYSLSATVILVVVASLSSVNDIFLLLVIGTLQFVLLSSTPLIENGFRSGEKKWEFFEYCACFVAAWVPIFYSFGAAWEREPKPPDAIVAIIFVLFALYASFVVVFWISKSIREYNNIEVWYVSLSFVTKTSLHWLLWSGISGRDGRVSVTAEEASASSDSVQWWVLTLATVLPAFVGVIFATYFTKFSSNDEKTRALLESSF